MQIASVMAAVCLLGVPDIAVAQQPSAPTLQHRGSVDTSAAPAQTIATGHTSLSADAEGEYPWKSPHGDAEIELYFEHGRLQGYLTEPLEAHSQHAAPLTFDFATTHVDGDALTFTTRRLHGAWFSFEGHLERGLVPSPTQSAYYLLTGTLTEHGSQGDPVGHIISLPREPGGN